MDKQPSQLETGAYGRPPIILYFLGEPVSKGRPRFTRGGSVYTPAKTRNWETAAKYIAQQEMQGRTPLGGPVQVDIRMIFSPSRSWPGWKQDYALKGFIAHTKKPDADNVQKAVKDAMNKIVYHDDSQITFGEFKKTFGQAEMVIVEVTQLSQAPCQMTSKAEVDKYLKERGVEI